MPQRSAEPYAGTAGVPVDSGEKSPAVRGVNWRRPIVSVIAGLVIGAGVTFAGVSIANRADGTGNPSDRMTMLEMSGDMRRMMADHAEMLNDMRDGMTPAMREAMEDDPMSRMMMSGEMVDMMKEHEAGHR